MNSSDFPLEKQLKLLALQLNHDRGLLQQEMLWALGEERIVRVTPGYEQFRDWSRQSNGLIQFWTYANQRLHAPLDDEEVRDVWNCIDLTLNARKRRPFVLAEYLMIAMRSDQKCEMCGRRPPEVKLDIDHILPVSKGGSESVLNLRFLCQQHNRSRGNRFRWADIWRRL